MQAGISRLLVLEKVLKRRFKLFFYGIGLVKNRNGWEGYNWQKFYWK